MLLAATIGFFALVLGAVATAAWVLWGRNAEVGAGLATDGAAAAEASVTTSGPNSGGAVWTDILAQLGGKPIGEKSASALKKQLHSAGYRGASAPSVYEGAKVVSAGALAVGAALVIFLVTGDGFISLVVGAFGAVLGPKLPERHLRKRTEKRRLAISRGLPDFIDLLVISVESGVSLNQAFAETAHDLRHLHPTIAAELDLMGMELQTGVSRADALRNLGTRTGEPELKKLTGLLVQADRFGSSVAKVLRTQAKFMRTKRKQRAEEMAHKVGVKMIFPIFFLIMPVVFLVTAGPAVFMLMTHFAGLF